MTADTSTLATQVEISLGEAYPVHQDFDIVPAGVVHARGEVADVLRAFYDYLLAAFESQLLELMHVVLIVKVYFWVLMSVAHRILRLQNTVTGKHSELKR